MNSFLFSRCKRSVNLHKTKNYLEFNLYRAAGGELQALLDDDGSLSEQKTRTCVREVLKALDYLHRRNIAHLDIKPQNILLNADNLEGKRSGTLVVHVTTLNISPQMD